MDTLFPHCAGLDVHKKTVVATVSHRPPESTKVQKATRTFETFTDDLLSMREWLLSEGVTHVAMEATGSYWKPVFNLLEDTFTTWVVNPASIKAVPGRKTDVRDSEWIAQLLQHGLLRPSFIPDRAQRELRELVRYRDSLIKERAREINRVQKVLEGANIKLGSVLSNILGVSGLTILKALAEGSTDPKELAKLADPRVRSSVETLVRALTGAIGGHQRLMLQMQLRHIASLGQEIAALDKEVAERTVPFEPARTLLQTIPGVSNRVADVILAEIGPNVEAFPSAAALAKWAGVAPGNNTSGGKRLSGRSRPGNRFLRSASVEAAWAASRTKDTYLKAQYQHLIGHLGKKKASLAVAHSIIQRVWVILKRREPYKDLGLDYFDRRNDDRAKNQAVKRLEALGYEVSLNKTA